VTGTGELFLGIIALSVLVMALIQTGAVVAGLRLARKVEQLSQQVDQEIKPLIRNLTSVTEEAVRTASLATRQVERVDRMFADLTARVNETVAVAQQFTRGPAKNGMAIVTGVQAAVSAFRGMREASRRRRKTQPGTEDDSLFIG
jgi:hypothetical protein